MNKVKMSEESSNATIDGLPEECMRLSRQWTRLGVRFSIQPSDDPVDLEELVVETAKWGRQDPRLLVMAASWLAEFHYLLDTKRFGDYLSDQNRETKAVCGVILAMAREGASVSGNLDAGLMFCRPLEQVDFLYPIVKKYPEASKRIREGSLPLFLHWGFWHNDAKLKIKALHTREWVVANCPEMQERIG